MKVIKIFFLVFILGIISLKAQNKLLPLDKDWEIAENQPANSVLFELSVENDTKQEYTFAITYSSVFPAQVFINGNKLLTKYRYSYESLPSDIPFTITATNPLGDKIINNYNLKVIDVEEAPIYLQINNRTIIENSIVNTEVGTLVAYGDNHDILTYTMPDNDYFNIVDNKLLVKGNLNYEMKSSHRLPVTVTDQAGLSDFRNFTILVEDVNEAPTAIQLTNNRIAENADLRTVIGGLLATDQDVNQTFTYTVPVNEFFEVTGNLLLVKGNLNYEEAASHDLEITVTDQGGLSHTQALTIQVMDAKEAPTAIQLSKATIAENAGVGSEVGSLTASDEDANQTFSYTITENENFEIVGDKLISKKEFDYEIKDSYSVEITVKDQDELSHTQNCNIDIQNVIDVDDLQPTETVLYIDEDLPIETAITELSVKNDTEDSYTYELFRMGWWPDPIGLSGNTIVSKMKFSSEALPESGSTYFWVRATNKITGTSIEKKYTLQVRDLPEAPYFYRGSYFSLSENNVVGTEVGIVKTRNDWGDIVSFVIEENDFFEIQTDQSGIDSRFQNAKLVAKGVLDFEKQSSYSFEIMATDQTGLSSKITCNITIEDLNEAPTAISLSKATIAENSAIGSEVGTLTASDEDADQTFTYTIAENENFELVGDKLVSKSVFDFETLDHYSVELTVADQDGLSHTQSFTISVSDVNEEPTAIQLSANSIAENSAIGTEVGTLIASDVDANQTFIYTIAENENFEIVEDKLISKSAFDFETLDNYSVVITVADQDGLSFKESFSIQITDANEAPNAIQLSNSSIVENAAVGTEVGLLTASDVDASQTFIYTIAENEFFDIAGNQILVKGDLNYEKAASHELEISVNDQGGLTYKQRFTIEIVDENDAPSAILLSNTSITENSAIVTEIGQLSATDEDANQVLTYSVADNYNFIIINDRLFTKAVFDYESEDSYSVEITVNDQDGLSFTKSFTIQVENLNEAPVFASEPITVIAEDVEYVYTVECMDIDGDALRVLAIEKPDWLSLLDNGDGTCTLSGTPALAGLYHVVLEAKDAEFTTQQEFDIEVEVVTGIEPDFTEMKVNVYPNPVVNDLHIDLSNFKGQDLSIALYSLTGSLIFKETHKNLGEDVRIGKLLQNLKSGMYLLVLDMDGFRKTYKIVRE